MKNKNRILLLSAFLGLALAGSGCSVQSYPSASLKEALEKICFEEYGISNIEVKIAGETLAVYLPLDKLFATDFKGSVIAGKVRNLETLFEPSPEALEKVEDVLFSISRVLLSTDKDFKFYLVQATDIENTGLQLILKGYVNDVRRVRIWDISREEYRKRVIHEMKQNRAVLWHRPVRKFFQDLESKGIEEIIEAYFDPAMKPEAVQNLFFGALRPVGSTDPATHWDIKDIRSARVQRGEVLVYASVHPVRSADPVVPETVDAQFLFLVSYRDNDPKILRVIPFQYLNEQGVMQKIPFPQDIQIEQSLESWEQEFPVEEIHLGDFLAEQLTRRVQGIVGMDERIANTFRDVKIRVVYEKEAEKPFFSFVFDSVSLNDFNNYSRTSLLAHEDMLYLLSVISREFVDLLRSYQFGDFDHLSLSIAQEAYEHVISRDTLELFRQKKIDFQGVLSANPLL